MQLSEDEIIKNMLNIVDIAIETHYYHTNMNGLVSHVDITLLNENMNSLKFNGKKINFINCLKYAEFKIFCICVDVYQINEGDDLDKTSEVLSTLKNRKLKINTILIEKYKDMLENPNFEQDCWSRTAMGIYRNRHDSVRLIKLLAYYDRSYYEIINYYDLMASILICLKNVN